MEKQLSKRKRGCKREGIAKAAKEWWTMIFHVLEKEREREKKIWRSSVIIPFSIINFNVRSKWSYMWKENSVYLRKT